MTSSRSGLETSAGGFGAPPLTFPMVTTTPTFTLPTRPSAGPSPSPATNDSTARPSGPASADDGWITLTTPAATPDTPGCDAPHPTATRATGPEPVTTDAPASGEPADTTIDITGHRPEGLEDLFCDAAVEDLFTQLFSGPGNDDVPGIVDAHSPTTSPVPDPDHTWSPASPIPAPAAGPAPRGSGTPELRSPFAPGGPLADPFYTPAPYTTPDTFTLPAPLQTHTTTPTAPLSPVDDGDLGDGPVVVPVISYYDDPAANDWRDPADSPDTPWGAPANYSAHVPYTRHGHAADVTPIGEAAARRLQGPVPRGSKPAGPPPPSWSAGPGPSVDATLYGGTLSGKPLPVTAEARRRYRSVPRPQMPEGALGRARRAGTAIAGVAAGTAFGFLAATNVTLPEPEPRERPVAVAGSQLGLLATNASAPVDLEP